MAMVLSPNSSCSGVTATDKLTRSKKLMMTPIPSSTAMRQRRLVHKVGNEVWLIVRCNRFETVEHTGDSATGPYREPRTHIVP